MTMVVLSPFIRYGRLSRMTLRAMVLHDPAFDLEMALDQRRDIENRDAEEHVDRSRGGGGFEAAERDAVDLLSHERQLLHADGQDDRRVLDEVDRFRRQRRQHDGHRLGEDDVARHLERGQAAGVRGLVLRARYGADPGTDDLADERSRVQDQPEETGPERAHAEPEREEEDLNDHRHVAEELDVRGGDGADQG